MYTHTVGMVLLKKKLCTEFELLENRELLICSIRNYILDVLKLESVSLNDCNAGFMAFPFISNFSDWLINKITEYIILMIITHQKSFTKNYVPSKCFVYCSSINVS